MKFQEGNDIEMSGIVTKTSLTGLGQNERFLVLKQGFLYYYSQVPKNYKENNPVRTSFVQTTPKHSINVAHIHMIRSDFRAPSEFIVQFQHKHLLAQKQIKDSARNSSFIFEPKNQKDKNIVSWKFKVANKQTRDKWVVLIKASRQKQLKQKVMIQSFFINSENGKTSEGRASYIPWGQNYEQQKSSMLQSKRQQQKKLQEQRIKQQQRLQIQKKVQQLKRQQEQKIKKQQLKQLEKQAKLSLQKQMQQQQKNKRLQQQRQEQQEQRGQNQLQQQQLQSSQCKIEMSQEQKQRQRQRMQQMLKDKQSQQNQLSRIRKEDQQKKFAEYFHQSPSQSNILNMNTVQRKDESKLQQSQKSHQQQDESHSQQNNPVTSSFLIQSIQKQKQQIHQNHEQIVQTSRKDNSFQSEEKIQQLQRQLHDQYNRKPQYYSSYLQMNTGAFNQRISIQKEVYNLISEFRDKATNIFKQLIDNQSIDFTKQVFETQYINFSIGVCQLLQVPNSRNSVQYFYNESKIEKLQKQFQTYQHIIGKLIKYSKQNRIGLVIPLVALIEYKGLVTLAVQNNNQNETTISRIQMENLSQALKTIGINSDQIIIKQHKHQKCYIVYVKQPMELTKSQTLAFDFPLNADFLTRACEQNCSISLIHLEKYRQLLMSTQLNPQTKDIIQALNYCIFLNYLRKVYRSSKGQLNEVSFWNLLFKKDKQLLKLVSDIGCNFIPQFKGVLLSYIRYYFGTEIDFQDRTKLFSGQFPVKSVISHPITHIVKLNGTQLQQTFGLLQKYISQEKSQLSKQIIVNMQSLNVSEFDRLKFQCIQYKKALILNLETNYTQSAQILEALVEQFQFYSTFRLKLYFLLIKNYSEVENDKILLLFKETIDLISLNYGQNHYELITLNCIMAHYFVHKKKDIQNGGKFYQLALILAQNYFSNGSVEIIEVLVDIGRMYASINNLQEAIKYLDLIIKMMRDLKQIDPPKKVKVFMSLSTILSQLGKYNEAAQKLQQVQQLCSPSQLFELYTLQYHIFNKIKSQVQIYKVLNKMFLASKNYKTFRLSITFTLSFIFSTLSQIQQQNIMFITEKIFVDGDCNHIQLIKQKMGIVGFGQYVTRVIKGLCSLNPQQQVYEQYLNRYSDIVGIIGKQFIVSIIESKFLSCKVH